MPKHGQGSRPAVQLDNFRKEILYRLRTGKETQPDIV